MSNLPNLNSIYQAFNKVKPYCIETPILSSSSLNDIFGAKLFFKCENFQKTGSFKVRGALSAVLTLTKKREVKSVATHSSGNHGAALAYAARLKNIQAHIVMPNISNKTKIRSIRSYGGKIYFCEPITNEREKTLQKIVDNSGATIVHPYNDFHVISGQGTIAIEFIKKCSEIDMLLTPVGGGGLLSGTLIAVKESNPNIIVIAGEPKEADDAFQSVKKGIIIPQEKTTTIADGLRTSLGEMTFQIIYKYVDDIITVSENNILEAMRLIWERMKIIVEPSSAVPLAALLENRKQFNSKRVGIILSGGNVDLDNIPWL